MKAFPLILVLLLSAAAVLGDKGVLGINRPGPIDEECRINGFDYGIAKFEWAGDGYTPEGDPSGVSVWGDTSTAYWNSTYPVAGVLHKEATSTYVHPGGKGGTVEKNSFGISHITFCGEKEADIPEFTAIGGILLAGLAGVYIFLKRG